MAIPASLSKTLDNLNSSTLVEQYSRTVVDNIFKKNPLLDMMRKNGKGYDGGSVITEPIMYDYLDGEYYAGAQVLNPADKEILTTGYFMPANVEIPVVMTDTDDLENQGRSAIIDLLETKFENAQKSMEKKLGADVYTAATSMTAKPFDLWGLVDLIPTTATTDPTAGNFGGISKATYAWWRSKVNNASTVTTGSFTFADMMTTYGYIIDDSGEKPDIIVTTQAMFNRLWSIADGRQQMGNSAMNTAYVGFPNIDFNGIPIIADPNCTAKTVYFINTKNCFLKYHKKCNMVWTPFLRPSNQLLVVKYLKWTGQLICNNPRTCGKLVVA